jgi:hypothetical protein
MEIRVESNSGEKLTVEIDLNLLAQQLQMDPVEVQAELTPILEKHLRIYICTLSALIRTGPALAMVFVIVNRAIYNLLQGIKTFLESTDKLRDLLMQRAKLEAEESTETGTIEPFKEFFQGLDLGSDPNKEV